MCWLNERQINLDNGKILYFENAFKQRVFSLDWPGIQWYILVTIMLMRYCEIKEGRNTRKINSGQSIVEYVIIFAIVVVLSIAMIPKIPGIFRSYVTTATGAMQ